VGRQSGRDQVGEIFLCLLSGRVLLGMERPYGQLTEGQCGQQLAYTALVILRSEVRLQTGLKIAASSTNNAVTLQIRTLLGGWYWPGGPNALRRGD
jgi:hypothetical protein